MMTLYFLYGCTPLGACIFPQSSTAQHLYHTYIRIMMLLNIKCSQNWPTLDPYTILHNIKYFSEFGTHIILIPNLSIVETKNIN